MALLNRVLFVCLLGVLLPVAGYAQVPPTATDSSESAANARIRLGPLSLTPKFFVRDVGLDSNVYHVAERPARDVTLVAGPAADAWLRLGRVMVSSVTAVEWSYFRDATRQRSLNVDQEVRVDVDLLQVTPYVAAAVERTRRRPTPEVDLRALHVRSEGLAGAVVRLGSRLALHVEGRRTRVEFAGEEPAAAGLASTLNRVSTGVVLAARWTLTPLTTLSVEAERGQDRFDSSPVRNSDSLTVLPKVTFKPLALIAGSAAVGYRQFQASDATLPDFGGVVAAVALRYAASDLTRFEVEVDRTLEYSFEPTEPYYVLTSGLFTARQVIGDGWDVLGRVGGTRLAYRRLLVSEASSHGAGRIDRLMRAGAGLGRRVGRDLRVGVELDYLRRGSVVPDRRFTGFRLGGTFSYGY